MTVKRRGYQSDLSRQSPILLDAEYKGPKISKMLAVLKDAGVISKSKRALALDIGCSRGLFTSAFAPYFDDIVGIDIDTYALPMAWEENRQANVHYAYADSLKLPFSDRSIDLVVCNHVYEHVPSAEQLFAEIYRVLKDSGVCYLGAASRLTLIEPHYHLPFLSWLPKSLAHLYMKISGKGDYYYERMRTYWGIQKLISGFDIFDYTLKIVADPDLFRARDLFPPDGLLARIPMILWKSVYWLLPSYIFILRKPARQ